jgi:(2Fe-2S) ferredoxin
MAEPFNSQDRQASRSDSLAPSSPCILVCHNKTCRKQGAPGVLKAFQESSLYKFQVMNCGCLGKCGNGPMVLVMPTQTCYSRVAPEDVSNIIEQHLGNNNEPHD